MSKMFTKYKTVSKQEALYNLWRYLSNTLRKQEKYSNITTSFGCSDKDRSGVINLHKPNSQDIFAKLYINDAMEFYFEEVVIINHVKFRSQIVIRNEKEFFKYLDAKLQFN